MSIEVVRNRDLFIKMWFMFYLIHVFKALDIKEEIKDILPTEGITLKRIKQPKILNQLLDFRILTKSGKMIIFEFKKPKLTKNDLKQLYEYYKPYFCKDDENTKAIFIVISKGGNITEYKVSNMKFMPEIIKTKEINKQQDLKVIRDKFENDEVLTSYECSLLIALPLFEIGEDESSIVEEICNNLYEKEHCIPENEIDQIYIGMYLNIVEYIDSKKQKELMEKINMEAKTEGVIASLKNEGFNQGKRSMIAKLLEFHSIEEIADIFRMPISEVREILEK